MKFDYEPWNLTEKEYSKEALADNSSLFFLGNGYLGLKGGFEEDCNFKGTFINGFYENAQQVYGESAYGFPEKKQTMLNLPDPTLFEIYLDDEKFSCDEGELLDYSRTLSLKEGLLSREIIWKSPSGRKACIEFTRCVSMTRKHLSVTLCSVSDFEGVSSVKIISGCNKKVQRNKKDVNDPRVGESFEHDPLICLSEKTKDGTFLIHQRTAQSGLELGQAVKNCASSNLTFVREELSEDRIDFIYEADCSEQSKVSLEKYVSYFTSIECNSESLLDSASSEARKAALDGFDKIIAEHKQNIANFWYRSDVDIDGDNLVQGIRFNIFSIYQSAGTDGLRNIAAKGLSGEGYEGHYFWDTEVYIIPFLSYTHPDIAEKLLEYRYSILDKARQRASVMSNKGALFPWRTINGEEASAYFPAGTAQYHIDADIAYGINKYLKASADKDFLKKYGFEIYIETARLWMSLGFFDEVTGEFRINCVTGPDEYTAIVNNNFYTNSMAKNNLLLAVDAASVIKKDSPEIFDKISEKLNLPESEIESWQNAALAMRLPYDSRLCIDAQDDSFLDKEMWDFSNKELNKFPLLLNMHPLVIYRYQIMKQPDVVLSNFLLGNQFSRIRKMRDYEYYNKITTGDSSLAPCIQSIMAAELGKIETAYNYFMKTARMDLDNINSNVKDGIHIACMGGTWMSLIYGFAGLRDYDGNLSFFPRLPKEWNHLAFKICYHGKLLSVKIDRQKAVYSFIDGSDSETLTFKHMGTEYTLKSGTSVEVSVRPKLSGVIFDLDGVITDTSELHYQAWDKLAKDEGFTFSREINEKLRGISRIASLDIILDASGITLSSEEKNVLATRKNEYYKDLLKFLTPSNILPGVELFLKTLKQNGIKTALASASKNAPTVLSRLEMTSDFDIVMDAGAVEKGKPDPEIFVSAAERLGLAPEQCAGVEDAAAGVDAIKGGGMFSVGIGPAAVEADFPLESTLNLDLASIEKKFAAY
ncbi:MAG: beta-phosphoglucomutase [Spirochaetales bacterium]|nr:beta-phosphoglucomutase [Spirochaetales bacterium]